ncbi:hypothetical protein GK047_01080 [Paenibacillus sp. SYP-B3998]|uniref:Uncharacterized protein n=1 Tax=Paenibacillus sp. SYP-B3998 TaxID=2678564 RepID=A0A6G3ZT73_9BACL|nr:hypothetical protein [Paenibacillus sp. SYP-B3998]NEW04617.1 hypothetical protein [Paenibacillus sp. SYP-B3998]
MKSFKSVVLSAVIVLSTLSASAAYAHPLVNLHDYNSYGSYLTALTQQYWTDGSNAHDQWELDQQNAQYEADIAAAKIYFGVK